MAASSSLRVLHVINQLRGHGGAEVSLEELLRRTEGAGVHHGVVLLRPDANKTASLEQVGVEVIPPSRRLGRLQSVMAVRAAIRSFEPDLVHTTLFDAGVAGRVAARIAGVPAVTSLVNTPYEEEALRARGMKGWKAWSTRRADQALARWTVRFHAISETVAQSHVRQLGISRARIEVIPRGKDEVVLGRRSEARRSAARMKLGFEAAEKVILAVGREEPQKGQVDLVEAIAMLRPLLPGVRMLLAGRPGRASAAITAAVSRLELGEVVTRLGARTDVPELLCAADLFAFPSLVEGLGVSVLEAMALEVPIVASDVPALRELLDDGSLAILVPPEHPRLLADAIRSALDEGVSTSRTAAAYDRFEERYRLDLVAERMIRFWKTAADRR